MSADFRFTVLRSTWTVDKVQSAAQELMRRLDYKNDVCLKELAGSLRQYLAIVDAVVMPNLFVFVDSMLREKGVFARLLLPEIVHGARCVFPPAKTDAEKTTKAQILRRLRSICEGWLKDGFLSEDEFAHMWIPDKSQSRHGFFEALFAKEDAEIMQLQKEREAESPGGSVRLVHVLTNDTTACPRCFYCSDVLKTRFDDSVNDWIAWDTVIVKDTLHGTIAVHDTCHKNQVHMRNGEISAEK